MTEIELGRCLCGCGGKTRVPKYTRKDGSELAGVPVKYIHGHNAFGSCSPRWKGGKRIGWDGYVTISSSCHPKSSGGKVREHVVLAEKALGRPLPKGSVVHHMGDRTDNSCLVICDSQSYHALLHKRMRAYAACGHPDWHRCEHCKEYEPPGVLGHRCASADNPEKLRYFHYECRRKYGTERCRRYRAAKRLNATPGTHTQ